MLFIADSAATRVRSAFSFVKNENGGLKQS